MNETTTRAAIESRAQKDTRRTAAAHARHAAPTFAPMTATAGDRPTIFPALHDMTPSALYYLPELCAAFVLRARERETGLQLFAELKAAASRDNQIMHHRAERAERAAQSRAEYEEARDTAAELDRIAARISTDPAIAEAAAEAAAEERDRRDAAREDADAIEKADAASTTSERATLVQAAAAEFIEMMTTGADLSSAIPQLCRAASAALAELANPDALTRNKTVTRWLDRDEADEIMSRYAIDLAQTPPQHIPAAMTKAGAACYKTIEPRDRKAERAQLAKHDPAALAAKATTEDGQAICMIYHYRTIADYVTFSQFAAPESAPELSTNGGINAIFNQSDRERINDLFDRAKLSERERILCLYAASQTADSRAASAYKDSMQSAAAAIAATDSGHRAQARIRAEKAADKAATAARWQYAFDRLSRADSGTRYTTATRDKYRRRICAALERARTAPEAPTAADRAEQQRRQWERMQRSSRRASAAEAAERIDLVAAAAEAASTAASTAPAIRWLTKAQANNRRAAERVRAAYLTADSKIYILNLLPENRRKAAEAEKLYNARCAAEVKRKREAEREAAKNAAIRHPRMIKKGVYRVSTTFEQWRGWTDEERAEHLRYLNELAKI